MLIISLKEEYYNQIIEGKKGFEYRKSFVDEPVVAFIYVSAPVKEIRAFVELGQPIRGRIEDIVKITQQDQPEAAKQVKQYLIGQRRNKINGIALPILSYTVISPIHLRDIMRRFPKFQPSPTWVEVSSIPGLADFLKQHVSTQIVSSKKKEMSPQVIKVINDLKQNVH